jgi:hypothetical protein
MRRSIIVRIANNNKTEYLLIDITKIKVDNSYQRLVNQIKVKNIISNFNNNAFGTLTVSKRTGDDNYYILDGQTRCTAAELKSIKFVPCCVIHGLTQQEEADLFIELNNSYLVRSKDRFKAMLAAENKKAVRITEILNKHGFKPNLLNRSRDLLSRKKGYVNNFTALLEIWDTKGEKILDLVMSIVKEAWGYSDGTFDPDAVKKDTIYGIYTFLTKCSRVDTKRLISKLRTIPAIKLIHEQNKNLAIYGKGKPYNYSKAVLELYNYRATNKIEFK